MKQKTSRTAAAAAAGIHPQTEKETVTMTNQPIDNELSYAESIIEIDLMNKVTGATYAQAAVYSNNSLDQVMKEYAGDIGTDLNRKLHFENKRTGATTCDRRTTIKELGLRDGDVLAVSDDGTVAGDEEAFEIDLVNKVTGATYARAAVYGTNTLGQVLQEYADDIGVNPNDSKILFENKRTGASTADTSETIAGLGLRGEDVLAVSDNAGVA